MEGGVKRFGFILLFLRIYGIIHVYFLFPAVLLFGSCFRFSLQQLCVMIISTLIIAWVEYHYPRKKRIIRRLEKENERLKEELKQLSDGGIG